MITAHLGVPRAPLRCHLSRSTRRPAQARMPLRAVCFTASGAEQAAPQTAAAAAQTVSMTFTLVKQVGLVTGAPAANCRQLPPPAALPPAYATQALHQAATVATTGACTHQHVPSKRPLSTRLCTHSPQVAYGHQLALVGDAESLGGWEVGHAPVMQWGEGHVWTASLQLPAGAAVNYKFIVQRGPGQPPLWEECNDRTLSVRPDAAELSCVWAAPLATSWPSLAAELAAAAAELAQAQDELAALEDEGSPLSGDDAPARAFR